MQYAPNEDRQTCRDENTTQQAVLTYTLKCCAVPTNDPVRLLYKLHTSLGSTAPPLPLTPFWLYWASVELRC